MKMPHEIHRERGPRRARAYVITISTSRYERASAGESVSDESGDLIVEMLRARGHEVVGRSLVNDDLEMIRSVFEQALRRDEVDMIISTGGTGISRSDVTIEAVRGLVEKEIEGFGELFRYTSFQRIGSSAMLTRALAGTAGEKIIIALPGSPDAVRTGLELILPEIPHILHLIRGS